MTLSVLRWARRSRRVLTLPRFRFALYAVRFHGSRSGAPLEATRRHSRRFASGYSLSLHRSAFVWLRFRSAHCVLPHAKRT